MTSEPNVILIKRDGSLERFNRAKLRNCLLKVFAGRNYDPALADPLARAIEVHLRDWRGAQLPSTEHLYRCLRTVLTQTGLSDAAGELALHRRVRQMRRERLAVVETTQDRASAPRWDKKLIIQRLQDHYRVRPAVARYLAGRIESQVLGLNADAISQTHLRRLIRKELLEWGLVDACGATPAAEQKATATFLRKPNPN